MKLTSYERTGFRAALTVFLGPMCTGKTMSLIKEIHKLASVGNPCLVLKHNADTRYTKEPKIIAHNNACLTGTELIHVHYFNSDTVRGWLQEKESFRNYHVIAMDEAHLLAINGREEHTLLACLAQYIVCTLNKTFVITALDRWYTGSPIKIIENLLTMVKPDKIKYLNGICKKCKSERGIFTCKMTQKPFLYCSEDIPKKEEEYIAIGGTELYEVLCRNCFFKFSKQELIDEEKNNN